MARWLFRWKKNPSAAKNLDGLDAATHLRFREQYVENDQSECDMFLRLQSGDDMLVHSTVILAHSIPARKLFAASPTREIDMRAFDTESVKGVVNYIYTETADLPLERILFHLAVTSYLGIWALHRQLEETLVHLSKFTCAVRCINIASLPELQISDSTIDRISYNFARRQHYHNNVAPLEISELLPSAVACLIHAQIPNKEKRHLLNVAFVWLEEAHTSFQRGGGRYINLIIQCVRVQAGRKMKHGVEVVDKKREKEESKKLGLRILQLYHFACKDKLSCDLLDGDVLEVNADEEQYHRVMPRRDRWVAALMEAPFGDKSEWQAEPCIRNMGDEEKKLAFINIFGPQVCIITADPNPYALYDLHKLDIQYQPYLKKASVRKTFAKVLEEFILARCSFERNGRLHRTAVHWDMNEFAPAGAGFQQWWWESEDDYLTRRLVDPTDNRMEEMFMEQQAERESAWRARSEKKTIDETWTGVKTGEKVASMSLTRSEHNAFDWQNCLNAERNRMAAKWDMMKNDKKKQRPANSEPPTDDKGNLVYFIEMTPMPGSPRSTNHLTRLDDQKSDDEDEEDDDPPSDPQFFDNMKTVPGALSSVRSDYCM